MYKYKLKMLIELKQIIKNDIPMRSHFSERLNAIISFLFVVL